MKWVCFEGDELRNEQNDAREACDDPNAAGHDAERLRHLLRQRDRRGYLRGLEHRHDAYLNRRGTKFDAEVSE